MRHNVCHFGSHIEAGALMPEYFSKCFIYIYIFEDDVPIYFISHHPSFIWLAKSWNKWEVTKLVAMTTRPIYNARLFAYSIAVYTGRQSIIAMYSTQIIPSHLMNCLHTQACYLELISQWISFEIHQLLGGFIRYDCNYKWVHYRPSCQYLKRKMS